MSELTGKQVQAITALLQGHTIEQAAEQAGVARQTVHTWLRDPTFAQVYADARRALVTQALDVLASAARDAAATMVDLMRDPATPPAIRHRVAEALLDRVQVGADREVDRTRPRQTIGDLLADLVGP